MNFADRQVACTSSRQLVETPDLRFALKGLDWDTANNNRFRKTATKASNKLAINTGSFAFT